jgi:hypothetical protein
MAGRHKHQWQKKINHRLTIPGSGAGDAPWIRRRFAGGHSREKPDLR